MPSNPLSRLSLTFVLALCAALAACDRQEPGAAQEDAASTGPAIPAGEIDRGHAGELMPAVNITDPEGRVLNLAALQGAPVLVNLWATWCAPCIRELPLLDDLAADYDERLQVITVSQDMAGAEKVVPFLAARDFTYLEPWLDPQTELGFALGGGVLPTTVLYDASGREVWRVTGDYDWSSEEARAAIDMVVAE